MLKVGKAELGNGAVVSPAFGPGVTARAQLWALESPSVPSPLLPASQTSAPGLSRLPAHRAAPEGLQQHRAPGVSQELARCYPGITQERAQTAPQHPLAALHIPARALLMEIPDLFGASTH